MASGSPSEYAASELPVSPIMAEESPDRAFPPYPPYSTAKAPPSVADTVHAGHNLRVQYKTAIRKPTFPPPRPAGPRGPKATDVKMARKALKAHLRCMRTHGAVLTDRLERISKPTRRKILYFWREYAATLTPETIVRLRNLLDADEPFKPDQAYEYFMNLRKTKKKTVAKARVNEIKKDVLSIYGEKRFMWARNATVAFAKGLQQRLTKPGRCVLADGMLRLSNIILDDICGYMRMKTPSRRSTSLKAKYMMEIADRVAVWIDEILAESDDRMLMMDFDEDEDILGGPKFEDEFLDMMSDGGGDGGDGGDGGGRSGRGGRDSNLLGPQPAYLKFKGPMSDAFNILTESMAKKGDANLLTYGKFQQTYKQAADELKQTPDFTAEQYNSKLANEIKGDLTNCSAPETPPNLTKYMDDMVDICSKFLAQHAEFNKDKGPAFKLLLDTMNKQAKEEMYEKEKIKKTYGQAATDLQDARGLESDHDDPNLSQAIHSKMVEVMTGVTPEDLKADMEDTMDICSKYLSQKTLDDLERGPAFDLLIHALRMNGADAFSEYPCLKTKFITAYTLQSAPGLTSSTPDPNTAPMFATLLHKAVDLATPTYLKEDMPGVIERCANYLSAFIRDRDIVTQKLLAMMKSKATNDFATTSKYKMDYGVAAKDTETAPALVPYLPIKDIADEGKIKLTKDMEGQVNPEHQIPMKALIQDVSRHLSQPVAMRGEVAGPRYPLEFMSNVKKSLGQKPLYKYKAYGQSYEDAGNSLLNAGPLQTETSESTEDLKEQIIGEMKVGLPPLLAPSIAEDLKPTMQDASAHLANTGTEKGIAMEHLVEMMKEKGENHLAKLQGYDQSYTTGAKRLEAAKSLDNKKVEAASYETVKGKLTQLTNENASKIPSEHSKHMPELVEETSKYLSSPSPETEAEKRKVLADMIIIPGEEIFGKEGIYKMTHLEGGDEVINSPSGVTTSKDEKKRKEILEKVSALVPNENMQNILKDAKEEGAAHLADIVKGRGDAMALITENLKKEKDKSFVAIGKFNATHEEGAQIIEEAPHFGTKETPVPVLVDVIEKSMNKVIPDKPPSHIDKQDLTDATAIASKYLADVALQRSGMNRADLNKMNSDEILKAMELAAKAKRDAEDEEARRLREATGGDSSLRSPGRKIGSLHHADQSELDQQLLHARDILLKELRSNGDKTFYEQPQTHLSHMKAADWLTDPSQEVQQKVKESGDTDRLHKKFEKKLGNLVNSVTPSQLSEAMQDVVIESARNLSEKFVAESYATHARHALISEMQKRGNDILTEVDGAAETTFFAAQRLKKAGQIPPDQQGTQEASRISKKLDETMRHCAMPRKIAQTVKDQSLNAANYLSHHVTKPNDYIEAYVDLLEEMNMAGDAALIEGDIPKSYDEGAAYLRTLTTFEDKLNRQNACINKNITTKLHALMADKTRAKYPKPVLGEVISDSAKLLTSYVIHQGEKTKALNVLVENMEAAGNNMLLRHGSVRKSHKDGAHLLKDKTADQLAVVGADPVVTRKIEIKLHNLMQDKTPDSFKTIMPGVIADTTTYLAVHLLEPEVIKVCKCKNVFVQCELWCEEILRCVTKPPCTCSRHVSVQDVEELAHTKDLRICPGSSRILAPGLEVALKECTRRRSSKLLQCPALKPTPECGAYLLHSTIYNKYQNGDRPTRIPPQSPRLSQSPQSNYSDCEISESPSASDHDRSEVAQALLQDVEALQYFKKYDQHLKLEDINESLESNVKGTGRQENLTTYDRDRKEDLPPTICQSTHTAMFSKTRETDRSSTSSRGIYRKPSSTYSSRTPITTVSTDQMGDWHAMMVSLMWNVQAWRKWIQENIDKGLAYEYDPDNASDTDGDSWVSFERRVTTEALQWQQYNIFSRQLTTRLVSRYSDKEIVSSTRDTVRTESYQECANEMMNIIDMFHRWTQWLILVLRESGTLTASPGCPLSLHALRWARYKKKIIAISNDWHKYNLHLKVFWQKIYESFITECAPGMIDSGPVWVVSACGAVPSGAVAAGVYDGEMIWIARTTHRCNVLPAALHPSKHCCLVYTDGAVFHYTKYQVMCNAEVSWMPWRAGGVGARAIRAAKDVFIGRVYYRGSHLIGPVLAPQYRCQVIIFRRPFSFNCYELLVIAN